jgi:hypothetical protein
MPEGAPPTGDAGGRTMSAAGPPQALAPWGGGAERRFGGPT